MAEPKFKKGDLISEKTALFEEIFVYKIRDVVFITNVWCYRLDCLEKPVGVVALDNFSTYRASEVERLYKVRYNYNKIWDQLNV